MTPTHALNFLFVGLAMIAGPAVLPEHFGANQMRSAIWLVVMGTLQSVGGSFVLLLESLRFGRALAVRIEESLELDLSLAVVRRGALPPSFYGRLEEPEEVELAWRLQRQLLRAG